MVVAVVVVVIVIVIVVVIVAAVVVVVLLSVSSIHFKQLSLLPYFWCQDKSLYTIWSMASNYLDYLANIISFKQSNYCRK